MQQVDNPLFRLFSTELLHRGLWKCDFTTNLTFVSTFFSRGHVQNILSIAICFPEILPIARCMHRCYLMAQYMKKRVSKRTLGAKQLYSDFITARFISPGGSADALWRYIHLSVDLQMLCGGPLWTNGWMYFGRQASLFCFHNCSIHLSRWICRCQVKAHNEEMGEYTVGAKQGSRDQLYSAQFHNYLIHLSWWICSTHSARSLQKH